MTTIESDLHAIGRGDRIAFSRLYRSTRPDFVRYATGLLAGDRAGAEDAVDDAFVAIWTQSGCFSGSGSGQGWMRRIVRNKAIDWLRRQRDIPMSGEPVMMQLADQATDAPSPFDSVEQNDAADALRNALGKLSLDHREVIWLCYFEDKSLAEIASIVQCPENTVKTRLFHARRALANAAL